MQEATPGESYREREDRAEGETEASACCDSGAAPGLAFMGVFFLFYFVLIGATMMMWALGVLCLWDCAKRDFPDPNTRAIWSVLLMLIHWVGVIAYYFVIYRHNDPPHLPRNGPPAGTPREDQPE